MGSPSTLIACGRRHTLVYQPAQQTVYAFGLNGSGQLGHGATKSLTIPVVVKALAGQAVRLLAACGDQSFALVDDGEAAAGSAPLLTARLPPLVLTLSQGDVDSDHEAEAPAASDSIEDDADVPAVLKRAAPDTSSDGSDNDDVDGVTTTTAVAAPAPPPPTTTTVATGVVRALPAAPDVLVVRPERDGRMSPFKVQALQSPAAADLSPIMSVDALAPLATGDAMLDAADTGLDDGNRLGTLGFALRTAAAASAAEAVASAPTDRSSDPSADPAESLASPSSTPAASAAGAGAGAALAGMEEDADPMDVGPATVTDEVASSPPNIPANVTTIAMLSYPYLRFLLQKYSGRVGNIQHILEVVYSSVSCMNASYLAPNHRDCSPEVRQAVEAPHVGVSGAGLTERRSHRCTLSFSDTGRGHGCGAQRVHGPVGPAGFAARHNRRPRHAQARQVAHANAPK